MDFDQPEASSQQALHEERNAPSRPNQPPRFRYSLRALLLLFVPVAILAFMFRWLHDNGHAHKVWHAGVLGAVWGVVVLAIWRGISFLVRDPKEPNEPLLQDFRTIFLAAFLGGLGAACFLALLLWAAKTFA